MLLRHLEGWLERSSVSLSCTSRPCALARAACGLRLAKPPPTHTPHTHTVQYGPERPGWPKYYSETAVLHALCIYMPGVPMCCLAHAQPHPLAVVADRADEDLVAARVGEGDHLEVGLGLGLGLGLALGLGRVRGRF